MKEFLIGILIGLVTLAVMPLFGYVYMKYLDLIYGWMF